MLTVICVLENCAFMFELVEANCAFIFEIVERI